MTPSCSASPQFPNPLIIHLILIDNPLHSHTVQTQYSPNPPSPSNGFLLSPVIHMRAVRLASVGYASYPLYATNEIAKLIVKHQNYDHHLGCTFKK